MKQGVFVFCLVLALFTSGSLFAQIEIPKHIKSVEQSVPEDVGRNVFTKQILQALNPGENFTSAEKLQQLLANNSQFVENVLQVSDSEIPEDEKNTAIDLLKTERSDFIETLLGKGKAAAYYKLAKSNIEPLTEKFKLAKLFF